MRGAAVLAWLCLAAVGSPAQRSAAVPPNLAALEREAYAKVNAYRVSKGLATLAWNEVIAEQARQHSADMADGKASFGHDGVERRVAAIRRRVPLSQAAENVAMNGGYSDAAAAALQDWLASPAHKEAIEGNYDLTGVGAAVAPDGSVYFTQIFVRSRPHAGASRRLPSSL